VIADQSAWTGAGDMFSINAPTASANTKLWIAGLVTLIISKATRSRSVDPKGRKNAERMIP
jgi:hypothetical protein